MRVVITGAGAVGRHLANDLAERGHAVTVIEQEPAVAGKADRPGVRVILGDGCEPWVLEQAEVRTADVLVAATGDDEDNLVTSLLAKQEFGVPRVLARVNHPKNEWLFNEQWGVDAAVSPPHILTAMVEEAVTTGDLVSLLPLEGGRVALVEVRLAESSPTAGRPLYELRLPPDAAIVAVIREGLTSVVTGLLFLAAVLLSPIAGIVPAAATAPALVVIGYLMFEAIRDVQWKDAVDGFPVLATLIVMPLSYSITDGIGVGFLTYAILKVTSGKASDVKPLFWVSVAAFVVYFLVKLGIIAV